MLVFGANVLVHATDERSDIPTPCRRFLTHARKDRAPTFFTWSICYEFLRVSTHPRVFWSPWVTEAARGFLARLLALQGFEMLVATLRHSAVLARILSDLPDLRVNVMHNLHTSVLMREQGVSRTCTLDADFR